MSFNGNKLITTGGGGMITTNDEDLARKARYLTTQAKDDPLEYVHHEIGYNYRLTNIQAAIGVAQMEQLVSYIAIKRNVTATYNAALAHIPGLQLPKEAEWAVSNCWMYTMLVDAADYGQSSRELLKVLQDRQIQSRPLWRPVHQQKPYQNECQYHIEVADRLYREGVSLPCSVGITEEDLQAVIAGVQNGYAKKPVVASMVSL